VATCGTAVWDSNRVFVSGGYPQSETLAIDAANKGKVLWRNKEKCYEQSMITVNGYLYALTDKGIMFCWRAQDGKEMWKQRLTGPVSASPVLVQDRIYWANELGTMYVMKANPEKFELLAENHIGNSSFASPAISGDNLLLRIGIQDGSQRNEFLYCFGQ
jgi:outer membrane protein assembly factor BamB